MVLEKQKEMTTDDFNYMKEQGWECVYGYGSIANTEPKSIITTVLEPTTFIGIAYTRKVVKTLQESTYMRRVNLDDNVCVVFAVRTFNNGEYGAILEIKPYISDVPYIDKTLFYEKPVVIDFKTWLNTQKLVELIDELEL